VRAAQAPGSGFTGPLSKKPLPCGGSPMFWALIGIVVLFGLAVLIGGLAALLRPT